MYHPFLSGKKVYLRGVDEPDAEGPYLEWLNDGEVTRQVLGPEVWDVC